MNNSVKLNLDLDAIAMDYHKRNQDIDLGRIKQLLATGASLVLKDTCRVLRHVRAEIRMDRIKAAREL